MREGRVVGGAIEQSPPAGEEDELGRRRPAVQVDDAQAQGARLRGSPDAGRQKCRMMVGLLPACLQHRVVVAQRKVEPGVAGESFVSEGRRVPQLALSAFVVPDLLARRGGPPGKARKRTRRNTRN